MTISWTSALWQTLPACLALGWLAWVQLRATHGMARLGGRLDAAMALSFTGLILGIISSPWQWLSIQTALPVAGALALAYILTQRFRGAQPAALAVGARALAGLLALACLWGIARGANGSAMGVLALGWGAALLLAERRLAWRVGGGLVVAIGLTALSLQPQRSTLMALFVFAAGILWLARARGRLSRRQIAGAVFALCAGIFVMLAAWPTAQPQPKPAPAERFSLVEWVGGDTIAALRAGWLLGNERPLTGWGTGTAAYLYPKVAAQTRAAPENVPDFASLPFQIYAATGALGLLGALGLVWGVFLRFKHTVLVPEPPPADGSLVATLGGGLSLLPLAAMSLVCIPHLWGGILPWAMGASLGLFAAAFSPAPAAFSPKLRWFAFAWCAALAIGAGAHTVRYIGACKAAARGDFATAISAYPNHFAWAAQWATQATQPQERSIARAHALQGNPFQSHLWQQAALEAYAANDWESAAFAAQNAYRLAPNAPDLLPLLAAIEGARGAPDRIPVLLALEMLNEPSFLLANPSFADPALREQVCAVFLRLSASLKEDLPLYAPSLAFAEAFAQWMRADIPVPVQTAPAKTRAFWEGLAILRQGGLPPLPDDQGWACFLKLKHPSFDAAKALDNWYAAHPQLDYPAAKREALLAQIRQADSLPAILLPIAGQPNPLWEDLQLAYVFPERGALPPAVRLPLYEGLMQAPAAGTH